MKLRVEPPISKSAEASVSRVRENNSMETILEILVWQTSYVKLFNYKSMAGKEGSSR
jgi:hypothetical protein